MWLKLLHDNKFDKLAHPCFVDTNTWQKASMFWNYIISHLWVFLGASDYDSACVTLYFCI